VKDIMPEIDSSETIASNPGNIVQPSPDTMSLIREYYQLRFLSTLSNQQADRLGEILRAASSDGILDLWITEVDHALGHNLNLLNPACRRAYENQQALLREYLGITDLCIRDSGEAAEPQVSTSSNHSDTIFC
jgi:hypothetical protein